MLQRLRRLHEDRDLARSLRGRTNDLAVLFEWAAQGEDVANELDRELAELRNEVEGAEVRKTLGGEHDRGDAIVSIHAGAGGAEAQEWAEMLLRMYLRWTERLEFSREVIDTLTGDDGGVKRATITVAGDYAYGLLLPEAGIHRLVRISPFSQSGRRHTSFASVFVWPDLPDDGRSEISRPPRRCPRATA